MNQRELDAAIAARQARIAQREAQFREERETAHRAARAAYKEQCRRDYPGTRQMFDEHIWPEKLKAFELAAAKSPVDIEKERLLGSGNYSGF